MTSENTPESDLAQGREWLDKAAELHENFTEQAYAAAVIGNGFIGLAHTTAALVAMETTVRAREAVLDALTAPEAEPEPTLADLQAIEQRATAVERANELGERIELALTWIDEPDDASPELRLTKIREALTREVARG